MSQTTGKTSTHIRNANVKESTQIQTGFKKTRFLHQATQGNTLIQLTSLTTPSGAVNYAAPNISELSQTNLLQWSSNLTLTSSLRGVLIQNISYIITGAQTIKLLFEAADAEIFEGVIDHQARTGLTMVDATPIVSSGTLAAGQTDFNVGTPFKVGEYASQRHGVVLVYLNGQLMYRNTGNQVPGPGVEGDYQEVHAGGGLGTLIRFNTPDLINDRVVSVVSVGSLVEKPNGSQLAVSESLQGQIDAMVPTLAALAGVAETAFQATPNNTDLKAFGDRVLSAEQVNSAQNTRLEALEASTPGFSVYRLTTTTFTAGLSTTWDGVHFNSGMFNPSTGIMTLPKAGMYILTLRVQGNTGNSSFALRLLSPTGINRQIKEYNPASGNAGDSGCVIFRGNAGDTFDIASSVNVTTTGPLVDFGSYGTVLEVAYLGV
jgi:hypothetical protein